MKICPRLTLFLGRLSLLMMLNLCLNLSSFAADPPTINCNILLEENQRLLEDNQYLRQELQASLSLGARMKNQLEQLLQIQTTLLHSMQAQNTPKTPQ